MAEFNLKISFDVHDASPAAHRNFIGQMLDQAKHAVGSSTATSGELTTPAGENRNRVGSWMIEGEPVPTPKKPAALTDRHPQLQTARAYRDRRLALGEASS